MPWLAANRTTSSQCITCDVKTQCLATVLLSLRIFVVTLSTVAGKGHATIFFFHFPDFPFPWLFPGKKIFVVLFSIFPTFHFRFPDFSLPFSRLFTSVFPTFYFRKWKVGKTEVKSRENGGKHPQIFFSWKNSGKWKVGKMKNKNLCMSFPSHRTYHWATVVKLFQLSVSINSIARQTTVGNTIREMVHNKQQYSRHPLLISRGVLMATISYHSWGFHFRG